MEALKKLYSELTEFIEWFAENWQKGPWAKRLILLDALLAIFANETILEKLPFVSDVPKSPYYYAAYYPLLAILFVLALAIEFYRKNKQPDILTFNPSERSAIKGLRAFGFQDAEIFKKLERYQALQQWFGHVTGESFRFGIIYGESGCGKTSFLQAGLCPAFAQYGTMQQGVATPICAVYVKFTDTAPEKAIYLALLEQINIDNPASELNGLLSQLFSQSRKIILFIFDQFEQFFLHYPQEEQRLPFIQLLASWYQANLPIKILISIRSDYRYCPDEIQKALKFVPNLGDVDDLKKFNPQQATAIFKELAKTTQLECDVDFVRAMCQKELAKADGLISPVEIQILAWVVGGLNIEGKRGFNEEIFLKSGGVEGLLSSFLERTIKALASENKRKSAIKVLLALIDKQTNLRAGALTLVEIQQHIPDMTEDEILELLTWLCDNKVRLVTLLEQESIAKYELSHEKLVPATLKIAKDNLQGFDRANLLLERRVSEWLGNHQAKRFLLSFNEWRLISKEKQRVIWGERRRDKEALILASKHRLQWQAGMIIFVLGSVSSGIIWWQFFPQGQIFECEYDLNKFVTQASDDAKRQAVYEWLSLDLDEIGNLKKNQTAKIVSYAQLTQINKFLVEKFGDEMQKIEIYNILAQAAATLGDKEKGLAYLTQLQAAAEKFSNEGNKANVYIALVQAAATLGDKEKGLAYLTQLQGAAEKISDEGSKVNVYRALAQAAVTLDDKEKGLAYLTQLQAVVKKISIEMGKVEVYQALAQAAATLGDKEIGLAYLTRLQAVAEKNNNEWSKAEVYQALAQAAATLGDKEKGLAYLAQAQTAAEKIINEMGKVEVYQALAQAAATLGDKEKGLAYLAQAQTAIEKISNEMGKFEIYQVFAQAPAENNSFEMGKVQIYQALAQAAATLGDKEKGLAYLMQAQTATEKISDEGSKAYVYQALAKAVATLGDKEKGLGYLTRLQAVAEKINNEWNKAEVYKALAQAAAMLGDKEKGLAYLTRLQAVAEKIDNEWNKAKVYQALAQAAATLGDKEKGLAYLTQLQAVAEKIDNEGSQVNVYRALAQAAVTLDDKEKGLAYLTQLQAVVKKISIEMSKVEVYQALAQAAATLGDKEKALAYLTQLQAVAEKNIYEFNKADLYQALAQAFATLGNQEKALQFIQQATEIAKKFGFHIKVFKTSANMNAQIGNYRDMCNLTKYTDPNDAIQIIAIVLREYAKRELKEKEATK